MRTNRYSAQRARAAAGIAAAVVGASLLTACGSQGAAQAAASIPAEGIDDGAQLTMLIRGGFEEHARAMVEAYNAQFQNQVALEIVPDEEVEALIGSAAAIGELPDIISGDIIRVPFWVENDIFQPVTDLIAELPFYSHLTRGGVDVGTTTDGAMHTVPFITDVSMMMWNRDLYRQAGLDPYQGPRTLQEFREHAAAIHALGLPGVSGTYMAGSCGGCNAFTVFPKIWASGAEIMNAEGTEALFDSDESMAVLEILAGIFEDGSTGPGAAEETGPTWATGWFEGRVGVMALGAPSAVTAREAGFDVGVGPIPGLEEGQSATFLGGDAIGISRDSANSAQAWHFINWTMSEQAQVDIVAARGQLPVRTDLIDNEHAQADDIIAAANAVLGAGRTPVSRHYAEAFNAPTSPWLPLFRDAVVRGNADAVRAHNDDLTAVLSQ